MISSQIICIVVVFLPLLSWGFYFWWRLFVSLNKVAQWMSGHISALTLLLIVAVNAEFCALRCVMSMWEQGDSPLNVAALFIPLGESIYVSTMRKMTMTYVFLSPVYWFRLIRCFSPTRGRRIQDNPKKVVCFQEDYIYFFWTHAICFRTEYGKISRDTTFSISFRSGSYFDRLFFVKYKQIENSVSVINILYEN